MIDHKVMEKQWFQFLQYFLKSQPRFTPRAEVRRKPAAQKVTQAHYQNNLLLLLTLFFIYQERAFNYNPPRKQEKIPPFQLYDCDKNEVSGVEAFMISYTALDQSEKNELIARNREEYGSAYESFRWISESSMAKATEERQTLLDKLREAGVTFGHRDTKLDCRNLSPGCRSCGEGTWSCLFINGICNAHCFYCPAEQHEDSVPGTNAVDFSSPRDYIDYLEYFHFQGASISGGEPLLTPEKTLRFIAKIKGHFGDRLHMWLYTNGILATEERLSQLKEAGLDEIRFNIGARNYNLDRVAAAVGRIDVVTVEVPAIPEEYERLKESVRRLADIGAAHLNLHQLRCTPFNHRHLAERNYTFLHGPKVTILESELTALRLMLHSLEKGIELPINYCSFVYKNTCQTAAARRRAAALVKKPYEEITATGLIRTLSLQGGADDLGRLAGMLSSRSGDAEAWQYAKAQSRLYIHASRWPLIGDTPLPLAVTYHEAFQRPSVSYRHTFKEIDLNRHKRMVIERRPVTEEIVLKGEERVQFLQEFIEPSAESVTMKAEERGPRPTSASEGRLQRIREFESFRVGLQEYF